MAYGVPRFSADVDVTRELDPPDPEPFVRDMQAAGFALRIDDPDFVRRTRVLPFVHAATGMPLDVVLAGSGLEDEFLDRAATTDGGGTVVPLNGRYGAGSRWRTFRGARGSSAAARWRENSRRRFHKVSTSRRRASSRNARAARSTSAWCFDSPFTPAPRNGGQVMRHAPGRRQRRGRSTTRRRRETSRQGTCRRRKRSGRSSCRVFGPGSRRFHFSTAPVPVRSSNRRAPPAPAPVRPPNR